MTGQTKSEVSTGQYRSRLTYMYTHFTASSTGNIHTHIRGMCCHKDRVNCQLKA